MKTLFSHNLSKKTVSENHHADTSKKRKSYYKQFLQVLIRKTEGEKRAQVFGMDPFK